MPEIEWRVNEDNREETIAATLKPKRRWRVSVIALMMVLGASLGAMYSGIQEPAPQPTATPTITPTQQPVPPSLSLIETIDREAQALADGDVETFFSIIDSGYAPDWFLWQSSETPSRHFHAWGRPSDKQSPLYYFIGPKPDAQARDHAWLDIVQYRNGIYFRETRFYRLIDNQWRRTEPDPAMWSKQFRTLTTQHFTFAYPIEDSELISTVLDQLEVTYNQVCADLSCPADLTFDIVDWPLGGVPLSVYRTSGISIHSPRITGLYLSNDQSPRMPLSSAQVKLIQFLIEQLSGGADRQPPNSRGEVLAKAVETWELNRLAAQPELLIGGFSPPRRADNIEQTSLESIWVAEISSLEPNQTAPSVIFFMEEKYGVDSVGKFLKAIGPSKSFAEAIKNSLGVDALQFEQEWKDWLKKFYAQGS